MNTHYIIAKDTPVSKEEYYKIEFPDNIEVYPKDKKFSLDQPENYDIDRLEIMGHIFVIVAPKEILDNFNPESLSINPITRSEFVLATMIPDFTLFDDRILVAPDPVTEEKTVGGVIISVEIKKEQVKDKPKRGVVVGIGKSWDSRKPDPVVKPGDIVWFSAYAGSEFELQGNKYHILRHTDLWGGEGFTYEGRLEAQLLESFKKAKTLDIDPGFVLPSVKLSGDTNIFVMNGIVYEQVLVNLDGVDLIFNYEPEGKFTIDSELTPDATEIVKPILNEWLNKVEAGRDYKEKIEATAISSRSDIPDADVLVYGVWPAVCEYDINLRILKKLVLVFDFMRQSIP